MTISLYQGNYFLDEIQTQISKLEFRELWRDFTEVSTR